MLTLNEVIENLQQLFALQEYNTAAQILETARELPELYNETVAIYDANLCLINNDYPQMWEAIRRGLSHNCKSYELYVLLGEYYLPTNPNQAYLCFENALFYCDDAEDKATIQDYMDNLKKECDITVRKTSFIILSYNLLDYTRNCIESIRENSPESAREIVIVDNASEDGSVEWLKQQKDIILRANTENSGFPKGCNEGVEVASKENDIFLFNNDTYLPPNALFWLRMGLYEDESHGAVGSVSNYVSNLQQVMPSNSTTESMIQFAESNNIPSKYPYEEKIYLVGFALLIRRDVYDKVGDLDERFSPGNYEDIDYGVRVLQAGYKNILCKNSFIIHYGHKSFSKNVNTFQDVLTVNAKKFKEKWGLNCDYYFYPRMELVNLIAEPEEMPFNILDIGCGCGAMLAYLKGKYPNATTYGVEIASAAADIARHFGNVICADIEALDFPWPENIFDYIIMGDVLEHLQEPSIVLRKLKKHLKENGHIITSIPNMKHYSVMLPLIVEDLFTYSDAGILDTTHLKMYTKTEIHRLITKSGYQVEHFYHTFKDEPNKAVLKLIDILASLSFSKDKTPYLAYQYIVKAKKAEIT